MAVWGTKVTKKKIEQLSRALFPQHGIKDVTSLLATIVKYRTNDGHVKIWRPEGSWSWFATPGTTVVTPNLVALKFSADYRRTGAQARDDLFRQLENAALSVMSEDEIEAAMARAGSPSSHAMKQAARGDRGVVNYHLGEIDAWRSGQRATPGLSASGERYAGRMLDEIKRHELALIALGHKPTIDYVSAHGFADGQRGRL
jgi:hypothetical protein